MPRDHYFSYSETLSNQKYIFYRFFDYTKNNDINLRLTDRYHIKKCCTSMSVTTTIQLLDKYIQKWRCLGRKEANNWINTATMLRRCFSKNY